MFNTKFLVFDTQFLVCNTKFIIFTHRQIIQLVYAASKVNPHLCLDIVLIEGMDDL